MIPKTVLTAMAVVLMAFSPAIARDWNSYEDGRRDGQSQGRGPSVAQEILKEQREQKRQEESDRKRANQAAEIAEAERVQSQENAARARGDIRGTGTMTRYRPTTGWRKSRRGVSHVDPEIAP